MDGLRSTSLVIACMLVASAALSSNSAFAGTGTAATSGGTVSFDFLMWC